jgi:molybdopterin converting factor small subunit
LADSHPGDAGGLRVVTVVRIPPILRVETGDRRDVEVSGSTVREVLETLVETFPGLDGRVLQGGRLQSFVNVYLDGADVETFDGLDTAVGPNSTLLLLPAMAGGSGEVHARFDAFDPVTSLGFRVELPARLVVGQPVGWTFVVENRGAEQRTLSFTSAQQGEVVLEAGGAEAYRWSRDRLFASAVVEHELPKGSEWSFTLDDTLSVEPGTYSLLATVPARPTPPPVRGEISVHGR